MDAVLGLILLAFAVLGIITFIKGAVGRGNKQEEERLSRLRREIEEGEKHLKAIKDQTLDHLYDRLSPAGKEHLKAIRDRPQTKGSSSAWYPTGIVD